LKYKKLFVKIPSLDKVITYKSRGIFLPAFICSDFLNMAISQAKPYVAAPGAGLGGMPRGAQTWLLGTMCGAHETF
jgi:hypothetical protein